MIWEDATVRASHAPALTVNGYLGYLFVETRRHLRGWPRSATQRRLPSRALCLPWRERSRVRVRNLCQFVFDHIPHHHVHVVARHPGAPREYWGTHIDEWPQAPRGSEPDIRALYRRLPASLATDTVFAAHREA